MDIFKKGNKITTHGNCLLILEVNETNICCQDLVDKDFYILDKLEHEYSLFDPKVFIETILDDAIDDYTSINKTEKMALLIGLKPFLEIL